MAQRTSRLCSLVCCHQFRCNLCCGTLHRQYHILQSAHLHSCHASAPYFGHYWARHLSSDDSLRTGRQYLSAWDSCLSFWCDIIACLIHDPIASAAAQLHLSGNAYVVHSAVPSVLQALPLCIYRSTQHAQQL